MVRRLVMRRRPSRTSSETELTFNESTSLSAAILRVSGIRRLNDSFSGETGGAELMVFIKPDIFLIQFGAIIAHDRMKRHNSRMPEWLIGKEKAT